MVHKAMRVELGYKPRQRMKHKINMVLGISTDEVIRMKPSRIKWATNVYPLIEILEFSRQDCIDYVREQGLGTPPRSACWMCPFRSDKEWADMKKNKPETFAKAVAFDKACRTLVRFKSTPYLHSSLVPLDEVEFDLSMYQTDMFGNECEGMCGN